MPPSLRILMVAPPSLRVPPSSYGGTQRGIADLVRGLRHLGHQVVLAAPGDSAAVSDELCAPIPHALWEPDAPPGLDREAAVQAYAAAVARRAAQGDVDLVNLRWDHRPLLETLLEGTRPVCYSLHNPNGPYFAGFFDALAPRVPFRITAHSAAHRRQFPQLDNVTVVPYGMDVLAAAWSAEPLCSLPAEPSLPLLGRLWRERRNYLLCVGRISPQKAQHAAIAAARQAGLPIVLAGVAEARDPSGSDYSRSVVGPLVDDRDVLAFGRASEAEKQALHAGALAVLVTAGMEYTGFAGALDRPLMEGPAAGTPVVAYSDPHGAAPGVACEEIVTPELGALGRTVAELAGGIARVTRLDRRQVRAVAEERFGLSRFARDCERLFLELVS